MTLVEVLIVMAILTSLLLLIGPTAQKIIRRSQLVAAHSTLRQVLATARLQAVKRGSNVVVLVNLNQDNKLRLVTFQDRANDETNPLPADEDAAAGNFKRDTGFLAGSPGTDEPMLGDVILPSTVVVWKQGGTKHDIATGVAFDGYALDSTLTNRIAFLPTGGIAPPEDTVNSGLPTPSGGRGIYFADQSGKNYFRITVDSDLSGRLRVDKYQAGTEYCSNQAGSASCPGGWTWY
jgi:type II secretory pathway pseudopilin PulG